MSPVRKSPTEEEQVKFFVVKILKRSVGLSAIHPAMTDIRVSDQFAGKNVQLVSTIVAPFVPTLPILALIQSKASSVMSLILLFKLQLQP